MRYAAATLFAGLSLVQGQLIVTPAAPEEPPEPATLTPTTKPYDINSAAISITSKLNEERAQTATGPPPGAGAVTSKSATTGKVTTTGKKTTVKKTTTKKATTKKKTTPKKKTTAKKTTAKKVLAKQKNKKPVKKPAPKPSKTKRDVQLAKRQASTGPTAGCTNPSTILFGYPSPNDTAPYLGSGFITDPYLVAFSPANSWPPAGYSTSFTGRTQALFSTNYLGYVQLPTYNTSLCAFYCNRDPKCNAFNIYFERTPKFVPNVQCPNPSPLAAVTCAMWGDFVDVSTANNIGQYKNDFMVVITASNGYNANPSPISVTNFTGPNALYGGVLTSSSYGTQSVGEVVYKSYDVQSCANQCQLLNQQNRANAIKNKQTTYTTCDYMNLYNLTDANSGAYVATLCELFGIPDPTYAANRTSMTVGSTKLYCQNSWGYALYPAEPGLVSNTWTPAPTGNAASCDSLSAQGKTYIDYNQNNWTIACNYDVQYSNDIGNATAPDFFSCMNLCDQISACTGYAYLGNTCYFKNLVNATRTPQINNNVDFAWLNGAGYAGFGASSVAATVTYTTITSAWTGARTSTTTSQNGVTNYVIVQTPGGKAPVTTTVYVDSGTASTIATNSVVAGGTTTYSVIYPTPSYCSTTVAGKVTNNYGVNYGIFKNLASGAQGPSGYPAYEPTSIKKATPTATGIGNYIGEVNAAGASVTIYGVSRNADTIVISNTFYLFAGRGTGYYTFTIPYCDDVEFVWVGASAVSGYTRANAAIMNYWSSTSGTGTPQTIAYYLTFGTYTAVRVQFGNGGGAGASQLTITAPDGTALVSSNGNGGYLSPDIVANPCNSQQGTVFPAMGNET